MLKIITIKGDKMTAKLEDLKKEFETESDMMNIKRMSELCDEILEIDSSLTDYRKRTAHAYYLQEDYENCIREYENYLNAGDTDKRDDDDISYFLSMSYLHTNRENDALRIMENLSEIERLKILLEYHSSIEDYETAAGYGEGILEIDCTDEGVLLEMSNIHSALGNVEWSLFYYKELCVINSAHISLYIIKLFSCEKFSETVEEFERIVNSDDEEMKNMFEHDLETPYFNYVIGSSYFSLERYDDAFPYILRCHELEPSRHHKFILAKNLFFLFEYEKSYYYLKKALELDCGDRESLALMSETCLYLERYDESLDCAEELIYISDDRKYLVIYTVIGAYHFIKGDGERGMESVNKVAFYSIPDALYVYDIAENFSKYGKTEIALKIFDTIIEYGDAIPYEYLQRARYHKALGNIELALENLEMHNKCGREIKEFDEEFDWVELDFEDI